MNIQKKMSAYYYRKARRVMSSLQGKVALVTGGNSGIGLATARAFHAQGARVVLSGRNRETLEEISSELGSDGLVVSSDVTKLSDIDELMARANATFGKLDILFVNAGILSVGAIEATDEESFDKLMNTNFKGAYFTIQKALPFFNKNGSIILNGSVNALMSIPNSSVYSASKAALHSLARSLSPELLERGIRINTITIGPTETPITNGLGAEHRQTIADRLPRKRLGQPEEVANVAVFLASSASSFVMGSEIAADGGVLLKTL
jgi:NAD(P)-dependent dehydrogenase (short-subunit alcohol dehydrogenase family)